MSPTPIGKLQRVPLREVWKHEAYDFTQWLQQNLDVLNTALGLNLVNAEREQAAGSFSIDLVAEDDGGGTVVIENQLEKSNHDHLGKLITYVTAMQARAAVWIISEPAAPAACASPWRVATGRLKRNGPASTTTWLRP
jgi:RecB family endonuclease NucS